MKKITIISLLAFSFLLSGCSLLSQNVAEQPIATVNTNTNKTVVNGEKNTNQVKEQVTDTKKYKNDEFGFEFQYPKDWTIDNERSMANTVVFDIGIPESREAISFTKNTLNLSPEQLRDRKFLDPSGIIKTSNMVVGGERALLTETTEMGLSYIIFNHGDNTYTITTGGRMIDLGITSTFIFTE